MWHHDYVVVISDVGCRCFLWHFWVVEEDAFVSTYHPIWSSPNQPYNMSSTMVGLRSSLADTLVVCSRYTPPDSQAELGQYRSLWNTRGLYVNGQSRLWRYAGFALLSYDCWLLVSPPSNRHLRCIAWINVTDGFW